GRRYRKNAEYQRGQRNTDRDWPRPRTHMAPPFFVIVALRGDVASGTCIVYGHRLYFGTNLFSFSSEGNQCQRERSPVRTSERPRRSTRIGASRVRMMRLVRSTIRRRMI